MKSESLVEGAEKDDGFPRRRPARAKRLVQGVLTILIVGYLVRFCIRERQTFVAAFSVSPWDLLTVVAYFTAYFVLYTERFVLLVEKHCGCAISLARWFRMMVVMRFLNNVVPQAGTVYRGVQLKQEFGVRYADYAAATLFFIWSDTVFNAFLAVLFLLVSGNDLRFGNLSATVGLSLFGALVAIAPFVLQGLFRLVPRAPARLQSIQRATERVLNGMTYGLSDPWYLVKIHVIAVASFLLMSLLFQVLFRCSGVEVSLSTLAVFYALYRLTLQINITPGNIGIRELGYGLLCKEAGVGLGVGVFVAAEFRVLSMTVLTVLGLLFGWRPLLTMMHSWWIGSRRGS